MTIENAFAFLWSAVAIYAAMGVVFAGLFLTRWYRSFDPSATTGTWGFRVLIGPGVVALWPLILLKMRLINRGGSAQGPAEAPVSPETLRRRHRLAMLVVAVFGPVLFAVALVWRAPGWESAPPVKAAAAVNSH